MQSKIEGVKEELLKCKINMAKAETEWYKKAAEECKNEKRIDTDKPSIKGGNESGEITSQEITPNHSEQENCGVYARYYQANNKIGHQGFNTSDLLRELYPEMYSNPRIAKHIEKGTDGHYGAVNFKFAFTGDIDSAASFSNMKCGQCVSNPQELSCQDDKIKSFCYYDVFFNNMECNKNLFSRESCPDLIRKSGGISVIKAKQVSPFILVNNSGQMIDKEGNNTQIQYNLLKPYLKANGKIKDCGNDQNCKDYNAIMKKVAWDTDKEVLLKTVFDDTQRASPYYEDNSVSDDTNFI